MFKGEVLLGCAIVRIFRADMFECCQQDVYKRQRCVCAAVFAPGAGVCWSVHVGQERYFRYPQRIDNDMHMDIAAVVVSVRVRCV